MTLDVHKKPQVQNAGAQPKGDVQMKSRADREAAKLGGFDVQMKKLSPEEDAKIKADMERNTVFLQDPVAMAKYEEDAKKQPAPKGLDTKVMADVEAEYRASTQPKLDQERLMRLAARCLELKKDATPDQRKKLEGIIAAAVQNDPAAQKDTVDLN